MGQVTHGSWGRTPSSPEGCFTAPYLPPCFWNIPDDFHLTVVLLTSTQIFDSRSPPLLPLQTFLVRRDSSSKQLVLCVHFPSPNESSSEVLEYTIKEEKSSKYPSSCAGL